VDETDLAYLRRCVEPAKAERVRELHRRRNAAA
jgi:hypothetical protein